MPKPFRLIWFSTYGCRNWDLPDCANYDWRGPDMYREMAQALESRGKLEGVVLADASALSTEYGGNTDFYVKYGVEQAAVHDPVPMFAAMAQCTQRLGLIPTLSTSLYPPHLLAQLLGSLDHISAGRAGWNIVTSMGDDVGRNFGIDLPSGNDRYDNADRYVEEVSRMWANAGGEGQALQMPRLPQGRPVFSQAGGSDRGRDYAAKHADLVLTHRNSVPAMKSFRQDMRARMEKIGRDPDSCKIFFTAKLVIGGTRAEALEILEMQRRRATVNVHTGLANFAMRIGYDVSRLPLDEPLPRDLGAIGSQGIFQQHTEFQETRTLREIGLSEAIKESYMALGSPEEVAAQLAADMEEIGGDGFAIRDTLHPSNVLPVVDRLVPVLQEMGLVRTQYNFETLRENLLDPDFTRPSAGVKRQDATRTQAA